MAQLKDTIVSGALRVTESIIANTLKAPSESNGGNYSVGENGQVLKSNGTSNYWGNEDSYKMITQSIEPTITTSKSYNKDELFIFNNQLLRATQNIAINTQINTGTSGNTEIIDLNTIISKEKSPLVNNAGSHNSIYRGISLGSAITAEQWNSISSGTFEDMFIGDYWEINGIEWDIAGFDYWLNTIGSSSSNNNIFPPHHIVIVPSSNLGQGQLNSTATTEGAYINSDFYTGNNDNLNKNSVSTTISNAFEGHIVNKIEYLPNQTVDGCETNTSSYNSTFELMTEVMVFGCNTLHNFDNKLFIRSINTSQLPLFKLNPSKISIRSIYWLRDVNTSTKFVALSSRGYAFGKEANASYGWRPVFGICA